MNRPEARFYESLLPVRYQLIENNYNFINNLSVSMDRFSFKCLKMWCMYLAWWLIFSIILSTD
jgi:hypothetical protein